MEFDPGAMYAPTLPAHPVAVALQQLHADDYIGGEDLTTFATGLGLDPDLVAGVLSGRITELDVGRVAQVCEGLHCSPYDLWGPEHGRRILGAYGPERWPRHIEPLDEGRPLPGSYKFLRRRLEQRAAEVSAVAPQPAPVAHIHRHHAAESRLGLLATPYTQTGILAIGPNGTVAAVDDPGRPAEPITEYHFTFRQMTEPRLVQTNMTLEQFAAGCPAGHDADRELASWAAELRGQLPGVEMVRFTAGETGQEQWLGWDTAAGAWQTWDDPRRYYPGDPTDVVDPAGLPNPPAVGMQPRLDLDVGPAVRAARPEPLGLDL